MGKPSKVRVYQLAKELGTTSKKIIEVLEEMKVPIKNHMSTVDEVVAKKLISVLTGQVESGKTATAVKDKKREEPQKVVESKTKPPKPATAKKESKPEAIGRKARKTYVKDRAGEKKKEQKKKVIIEGHTTVGEFASKIGVYPEDVLKLLLELGIILNINKELAPDIMELVATEYELEIIYKRDPEEEELFHYEGSRAEGELASRFPVVAVLGHVDHGKTSLLDYIRQSNVTAQEAGGITQHIGAYKVYAGGKGVLFLDTPGHEAFTSMRARGAQATDIAVLVVAADDGVMPQTVEAINHAKASGVHIIVAINKIDKPDANPDRVKQQLSEYGLVPEEWGGETIFVPVSAIRGDGVDELLEMILLVAEINNLKIDPHRPARGIVIEAKLDKGRGPVATILIQDGTLKVAQPVICGSVYGKVRALTNDSGEKIMEADSSVPVEVIGLNNVPQAGDMLQAVHDEKFARQLAGKRLRRMKEAARATPRLSLEDLFEQIKKGEVKDLNLIIKGDTQGSVEALQDSLLKLSQEEVKIKIIHSGVGAVNESDVMLAAASNAAIIGFNVRPDINARKMAEMENVNIRSYRIIYEAIEEMQDAITGMLDPVYEEVVQGEAEVRQIFKSSRFGTIAGSYISDGRILRNYRIRVIRDGKIVHEGKIESLKRFKEDVKEVSSGYECGILVESFNDVKKGDILEAYTLEETRPRKKR
ncbi:MAG: translation initiation factor IF-2 [Firmicutes bacterium]|nr:translation initiation factor IF-2 [Bacillota bacterium]